MRYLICYTRPEPKPAKYGPDATFEPDVEVGDFATDKEAIDRATALLHEKQDEYFAPSINAIVRDGPDGPKSILTAAVKADINGRLYRCAREPA